MNIHFIKSSEKRKILEELNEKFGIEELPYLLIESGKEKIRAYSGSMNKDEMMELCRTLNVESIGVYLIKREDSLRLGFDATQILSAQINKNIIDVDEQNLREWLLGNDLKINANRGVVVIRYKDSFIGCGKSTGEKIINHVPKERRLRK